MNATVVHVKEAKPTTHATLMYLVLTAKADKIPHSMKMVCRAALATKQ